MAAPEIYYPVEQSQDAIDIGENDAQWMTLVIRADPAMLVEPLRKAIAEIDRDLPLYQVRPWSQVIAGSMGDRRLKVWLVGTFPLVALLLSALASYATVSYSF